MPERQCCQELTRRASTDGRVVLQRNNLLQEFLVVRRQPGKPESRQTVGFANRAEANSSIIQVASRWQARGWIVLELPVDFVRKDVDVVLRSKLQNAAEDFRRHQQPGRIVGSIDIERAGVRANQGFECSDVVGPAALRLAVPLTDGCACALRQR